MRILVVDDNEADRVLLSRHLKDMGQCDAAASGTECVKAFSKALGRGQGYDLVLMDVVMPGMDGRETLRRLRQVERDNGIDFSNETRVVMVSAMDDGEAMLDSVVGNRAISYLVKPFGREQLLATVRDFMA